MPSITVLPTKEVRTIGPLSGQDAQEMWRTVQQYVEFRKKKCKRMTGATAHEIAHQVGKILGCLPQLTNEFVVAIAAAQLEGDEKIPVRFVYYKKYPPESKMKPENDVRECIAQRLRQVRSAL